MYVVVGANGFLGSYIVKNILEKTDEAVLATCRDLENIFTNSPRVEWLRCDIEREADRSELVRRVNGCKNTSIAFLAALHNPDAVESDPERAYKVNVTILDELLSSFKGVRCLFYPSTDSVYGESENGYHFKEDDQLRPVNTYGKQKAAAEAVVIKHGFNVVRFPFLIDPSLLPHKKHFYDIMAESFKSGKPFELFSDSLRSSLNFNTVAALTVTLMKDFRADIPKVMNLSGDDDLSKHDIGVMLAHRLGVNEELAVAVSIEDGGIFKTPRAKTTLLDNTLAKRTLGLREIKIKL